MSNVVAKDFLVSNDCSCCINFANEKRLFLLQDFLVSIGFSNVTSVLVAYAFLMLNVCSCCFSNVKLC